MAKTFGIVAIALLVVIIISAVFLRGCDQTITKRYGGTTSVELNAGERLEMVTWKDDQMWIQVRPRTPDETPIAHEFREHSKYGMLQGKVVLKEK